MDNSNLPPQTPATPNTPTPGASPTQAPTPQTSSLSQTPAVSPNPETPRSGNKMVLWFVIGLVVVVAVVGGIYFFLSKQQQQEPASQPQVITTQTPVPIVEENLEDDLNSINVETDTSSDFAPIDQDMQQL